MKRFAAHLFAVLFAVSFVRAAYAESILRVPADHGTIQAAIEAAPDGATIAIAEGVYNEQLMVSRPLSLVGEGEVIVRSIDRQRPVFSIVGVDEGSIRGIIFESISPRPTNNPERRTEATVVVVGGAPAFEECTIRNGSHSGLKVGGEATPTFVDCVFEGHGQSGAFVFGVDAHPRFTNCRFVNNRRHGISFAGGAGGTLEDCEIEHNNGNGITLMGRGTAPSITGATSQYNLYNGIVIMEHAAGLIEDSAFLSNGASGINLQEVDGALVIRGNRAEDNAYSGFHLAELTTATIEKNRFVRNGVISSGEISLLVHAEDFEALDLLEERLRVDEVRFLSGAWQLGFFYSFVLEGWRGSPQSQRISFKEWCGRWQYARPDSAAARIARAKWHAQQAWNERGPGDPGSVLEDSWRGFATELSKAYSALLEVQTLVESHPQAYADRVHVLASLETMPSAMDAVREAAWAEVTPAPPAAREVFEQGVDAAPGFVPLYTTYARFLLPRLGGEPGAIEAFAAEQAGATEDLLGDGLYAIIANDVLRSFYLWAGTSTYFKDYAFAWPRVVQGHRDLIERYPASTFWRQSLALQASLQGDKDIAAEIFEALDAADTRWDSDIWHEEDRYLTYRAWAVGEGPYPEVSVELLLAVQMGDIDAATALIEEGRVLNAIGQLGYSPLTFAVDLRNLGMTNLLLEHGADPDFQLYRGIAPLHKAAGRNDLAIVESLLEHGADINLLSDDGSNALMYAAYSGRVEAIDLLARRGADIDLRHPTGSTAFIVAVRQGHMDAAKALLEAGADPNAVTHTGENAASIARANGHEAIATWLEVEIFGKGFPAGG